MSWGARSSGLGESLLLGWHRVLRFVIARDGGHGHVWPITRCSGGDGVDVSRDRHPDCGGRLTPVGWTGEHRRPRVKAIGSKTIARRTGQTLPQHNQDHHGERRGHHEHEACGTKVHQRRDPPPFEAEQRNHPRRRHLPDRIVLRRCRDARFRGGYLGPVGHAGSTVTPRNSWQHKH